MIYTTIYSDYITTVQPVQKEDLSRSRLCKQVHVLQWREGANTQRP